jgi:hypothetical protein
MVSTIPGGWTYTGRTVFQLYVTWTGQAGSTINISVPAGSSIDFGSVNSAAGSAAPEPGTFLLGFPLLAVAAGMRYRHTRRFRRCIA